MRVTSIFILATLKRGGCIKSFYRLSSHQSAISTSRISCGYVLVSPDVVHDIILSYANFIALQNELVKLDSWEHELGTTCLGGATWGLRSNSESEQ